MALYINTNVSSLNAQINLSQSNNSLRINQERLSSGLRINSAKDDAAGLAISDRFTAQIRGLNQAARNANDGISLAQTAEGALQETTNILQRMRELAIQSANDSNTASDRASIQAEVSQLQEELDRIADTTTFNNRNLLDGSFSAASFHVGANANESISVSVDSAKASDLGSTTGVATGEYQLAKTTSTAGTLQDAGSLVGLSNGDLTINGTNIRSTQSGDDTVSTTDNGGSAIALAAAINDSAQTTGVRADASNSYTFTAIQTDLADNEVHINGVNIGAVANGGDANTTAANFVNAVNAVSGQTGVSASASSADVTLTSIDGRNIQIEDLGDDDGSDLEDLSNDFSDEDNKVIRGTIDLYSNESFEISGTNPERAGLSEQTVNADTASLIQDVSGTAGADTWSNELQTGDLTINGYNVEIGSHDTDSSIEASFSAKNIAESINNTDGLKEQVSASAKTIMNLGKVSEFDASSDNVILAFQSENDGGVADTSSADAKEFNVTLNSEIKENDASGYLVGELNSVFATEDAGLVASTNSDGELLITAEDGRNIRVSIDQNGGGAANASGSQFLSNFDTTVTDADVAARGTISLEAKEGYTISSVEGGKQALAGIETQVGTVANIDMSTQEGANNAITALDAAIQQIDTIRGDLGAIQNRFESTIANLENVALNLTDARSRILDADIAKEASEMTQNNVKQQAGAAILAQANQNPQLALQLLGG